MSSDHTYDIFVIGGGVNGCGITRDAAGRGYRVALAEMNDLASATSSASTKLFHGGLRYLEFFEFHLVREALREREVLLSAMPHISWPMRFVLPISPDMRFDTETPASRLLGLVMPWMKGRRPAWMIRLGLFLYDNMGGRRILPATRRLDLRNSRLGAPLDPKFHLAFEYSDCAVQDSRLVVLNARDAAARGARVMVRTRVTGAERTQDIWRITTRNDDGHEEVHHARILVNASGPWVSDVIRETLQIPSREHTRLVRGSHIVTRKLYDHDECYFFQGSDGRIIFAIPYEDDFTLIGTTDADHPDPDTKPVCTEDEAEYLRAFANTYFRTPIEAEDIVWTYSGVRPLYDDGATSATAATREYVLSLHDEAAPLLNVFGGKITTYRKLAEDALARLEPFLPDDAGKWTAGVPLPGGDFPVDGLSDLIASLRAQFPFLDARWAKRLARTYGTEAFALLEGAKTTEDLGPHFGHTITARELNWTRDREWARTAEDYLWRRTRMGLHVSCDQAAAIAAHFAPDSPDV